MPGVLYRREKEILEFLIQYQNRYGYSPILKEIAAGTSHKAVSTICQIIKTLVEKGYVQKVEGNSRTLRIIDTGISFKIGNSTPSVTVPFMGYLLDGKPLEQHPDKFATYFVATNLLPEKNIAFALQVRGDFLINDGIFNSDFLIFQKEADISDGNVVLAIIDGGIAVLKRICQENDRVVLKTISPSEKFLYPNEITIKGKCVAVTRKFT